MNVSLVCFHLSLAKSHFSVHLVMWLLVHLSIVTFDANGHSLQVETTAPSSVPFNSAPSLIFLNQTEDNSTEQYDQPPWAETFKSLQINNLSQGFQVDSLETNPAHLPLVSVGSNHDDVGEVTKTHKKWGGVDRSNSDILIRIEPWSTMEVNEGQSTTFRVSLLFQPTSDVKIAISPFTTSGLTHSQSSPLTFTSSNYNERQSVTIIAAEDDGNTVHERETLILLASGATGYDGLSKSLPVQVIDNDISGPQIIITPASPIFLDNNLDPRIKVRLSEMPDQEVIVTLSGFDNPDVTIKGDPTLTFTSKNFSDDQWIYLGISNEDPEFDNESAYTTFTASGGIYEGVTRPYRILIEDHLQTYGLNVSGYTPNLDPNSFANIVMEEPSSITFQVSLKSLILTL